MPNSTRRTRRASMRAIAAKSVATLSVATVALSLVPSNAIAADSISIRLKVGTSPAAVVSVAPKLTPAEAVTALAVPIDGNDLVELVRDGRQASGAKLQVREGDTLRIITVDRQRVTKTVKVPATVVEVPTTKLAPGRREVVRKGKAGLREIVAKRTFHNGEPVKYRIVDRTLVEEPTARRVLVGREPWSVPGTDGLNWAALAGCESGGNPRAVNPAGYYGLYQFSVGTWHSVGGSGMPHHASPGEQTYRAKLLYKMRGRSPWPHCGRLL